MRAYLLSGEFIKTQLLIVFRRGQDMVGVDLFRWLDEPENRCRGNLKMRLVGHDTEYTQLLFVPEELLRSFIWMHLTR